MLIKGHVVKGSVLDDETRCAHYHSALDRIAIKFYCCGTYFPCYKCHKESGCNNYLVWPSEKFDKTAILCGPCGYELTISEYLTCKSECPSCSTAFNPGCNLHWNLYFET